MFVYLQSERFTQISRHTQVAPTILILPLKGPTCGNLPFCKSSFKPTSAAPSVIWRGCGRGEDCDH